MKFKKSLIATYIILFMFTLAGVNAIDINDTLTAIDNNTEVTGQTEDAELLTGSDNGTFTSLQEIISDSEENSTINLDKDYTYDEGFNKNGIEIDKSITINGNGHTINGLSSSRIFLIKFGLIENHKVTLNNIKFKNGYTDLYGGAIFNYAELTVNNCEFSNNYAKNCGGAINSVGYLDCRNSKFNSNTAGGDGGAVLSLSIYKAHEYYKEIYPDKVLSGTMDLILALILEKNPVHLEDKISNCVFKNNKAKGRGGGGVYAFSNIYIKSSTFKSNQAGEHGGAVFGNMNLKILNSKFTKNKAPKYGGAVYFKCHEYVAYYENGKWKSKIKYYTNLIKSSKFTKNTASKGGAIFGFTTSTSDKTHCAKAVKCTFAKNKASKGRDIYGGTASKCTFNYLKLTLKSVKIKKNAKKLILKSKLTKGKKLIKGKKIKFKFNGKSYKAKTNKKGIAKVKITKKILKKLKIGKKVKYQAKYKNLIVKRKSKVK